MPQVRENPLPKGRYWIFVQKPALPVFEAWLQGNAATVTLERREDSGGLRPFLTPNESFFIFSVNAPTVWTRGAGFPNTAGDVTKADDVGKRPPPITPGSIIRDMVETAEEGARDTLIAVGVLAAIYYLATRSRRRR